MPDFLCSVSNLISILIGTNLEAQSEKCIKADRQMNCPYEVPEKGKWNFLFKISPSMWFPTNLLNLYFSIPCDDLWKCYMPCGFFKENASFKCVSLKTVMQTYQYRKYLRVQKS